MSAVYERLALRERNEVITMSKYFLGDLNPNLGFRCDEATCQKIADTVIWNRWPEPEMFVCHEHGKFAVETNTLPMSLAKMLALPEPQAN
jgi:hypothetical protein